MTISKELLKSSSIQKLFRRMLNTYTTTLYIDSISTLLNVHAIPYEIWWFHDQIKEGFQFALESSCEIVNYIPLSPKTQPSIEGLNHTLLSSNDVIGLSIPGDIMTNDSVSYLLLSKYSLLSCHPDGPADDRLLIKEVIMQYEYIYNA